MEASKRQSLERLIRYVARSSTPLSRLYLMDNGSIRLRLKTPYHDGTSHIVFIPMEFLEKLMALVPRPRINSIRFHGILASHAKLRFLVVPKLPEQDCGQIEGEAALKPAPPKYKSSWARLLKRVFDIDIHACQKCGKKLKLIAAIEDLRAIEKILSHVGLPIKPPKPMNPKPFNGTWGF